VRFCIELTRKPGARNLVQQQRQCRIHVTARNADEAITAAEAEAKRTGIGRYFEIIKVRQV